MKNIILLIMVTTVAVSFSMVAHGELVEHWLFNEPIGTKCYSIGSWGSVAEFAVGNPTWVTFSSPLGGRGLQFNGGDRVDFVRPGANNWGTDFDTAITLLVWVKFPTLGDTSKDKTILGGGESGAGMWLDGQDFVKIRGSYGMPSPVSNVDTWYLLGWVAEGPGGSGDTETLYISIPGFDVFPQLPQPSGWYKVAEPVERSGHFGGKPDWGDYLDGTIDEIQIYDHALTEAEINAIWQQGAGADSQTIILAEDLSVGYVGESYSGQIAASGGTDSFTYSIVGGALPDGLNLDPVTGAITGIPTVGNSFTFTARATDDNGDTNANNAEFLIQIVDLTLNTAPSVAVQWYAIDGEVYTLSNSDDASAAYEEIGDFTVTGGDTEANLLGSDKGDVGRTNPTSPSVPKRFYKVEPWR